MAVLLKVRDWEKHFENNRTRELKRMDWVPIPNKQDGDGYTELLDHPDGAAHFGAFIAIVEVASKCSPRGVLVRDGGSPHDSASLARITRIPATVIDAAIPRLVDPIGWLEAEVVDDGPDARIPQEGAARSQEGAALACARRTERKGTERKEKHAAHARGEPAGAASPPPSTSFPEFECIPGRKSRGRTWRLSDAHAGELTATFPGVDVPGELRKAWAWLRANPARRKTADGMPSFLFRWLEREQNRCKREPAAELYDPPEVQAKRAMAMAADRRNGNGAHP